MEIIASAISGSEASADETTPIAALVSFYQAFNTQNLELMEANWLHSDEASMSNPLGGLKRGWNEIRNVYEKIFHGSARVFVEFYDYSIHTTEQMFIAVGRERGTLTVDSVSIELQIRTSRAYRINNGRWKQLHHHGSMDNANLLAKYQTTLLAR